MNAELRKKILETLRIHKLLKEKGFVCEGGSIFYGLEDYRMYVGKEENYKYILSNIHEIKMEYQLDLEDLFQLPLSKINNPKLTAFCPQPTKCVELSFNF